MFNASTVAQMAAFFANKEGGKINVLKLMKLMYLADREAMRLHQFPISMDEMVSMKHGPVLLQTLSLIHGDVDGAQGEAWNHWITDRANHEVATRRQFKPSELDRISKADLEILEAVWKKFGGYDPWKLRNYTHKKCKEWRDPLADPSGPGVIPINEADIFRQFGTEKKLAEELAEEIRAMRSAGKHFEALES